jgi:hypothetical protein
VCLRMPSGAATLTDRIQRALTQQIRVLPENLSWQGYGKQYLKSLQTARSARTAV